MKNEFDFSEMRPLREEFDFAPLPRIVRERCPDCAGSGLRALGSGPLAQLVACSSCVGRGFIAREAA